MAENYTVFLTFLLIEKKPPINDNENYYHNRRLYMMKRIISFITILTLFIVVVGCSETTKSTKKEDIPSSEEEATTQYTDALNREVTIPTNPKRVVALWSIGEMLTLDEKPIGSTSFLLRFYSDEEKKDIEIVGEELAGSYEKMLSLNPDLIIVYERVAEDELAQLEKIAPTVTTPFYGDPVESLTQVAKILNKEEQVEAWLANYNERVTQARENTKDLHLTNEKALVLQLSLKNMYIYHSSTFPTIYDAFQFQLPDKQAALQQADGFTAEQLSLEVLPEFNDVDRIFLIVNDDESQATYDALMTNPIWQEITAVKNNKVYNINKRLSTKDVSTLDWALDEVQQLLKQ